MTGMPHPAFSEARITIPLSEQHAYLENYSADLIQATIERANLFADDKLAKGESVNMGAIYMSSLAIGVASVMTTFLLPFILKLFGL